MKISDVISLLEQLAPPALQESYDNSRLICGDATADVTSVLVSLDCTESVVTEAINSGCNMIIAHHPIVFSGMKSLTGRTYVERTVISAIKNDIAIYAIHTNLDNVSNGVNARIAQKLGVINTRILKPKSGQLRKLNTFVPTKHLEEVRTALFEAGAGSIGGYDHCSFHTEGKGTFRALEGSNPFVGQVDNDHEEEECQLEVIFNTYDQSKLIQALKSAHPYETVAYDIHVLENKHDQVGSGMIGELASEMEVTDFLSHVGEKMKCKVIRHTAPIKKAIKTIAFCGGSGSFLLGNAMVQQADAFITGDFKYHEFFDADEKIMILDIGHFESEQFTPELIKDYLADKNVTFAVLLSQVKTNPVHYFIQ